jgi:hypothetical protein
MADLTATQGTPEPRPGLWTALKIIAAITPLLVLLQAFLAGRGLYIDHDYIDIHGGVANGIMLVVLAQAVLAYLAMARGYAGGWLFGICCALVVLVVAQIGLGYSGRDSADSAAIHIPNGVLILGLSVVAFMQTRVPVITQHPTV